MTVLTETNQDWEFVRSLGNGEISKEAITLSSAAAGKRPAGEVLGKITATGEYVPLAPAASDGSEVAAAILGPNVTVTTLDVKTVALKRLAEVNATRLVWPAGITTNQKNAAIAQLASAFILLR